MLTNGEPQSHIRADSTESLFHYEESRNFGIMVPQSYAIIKLPILGTEPLI